LGWSPYEYYTSSPCEFYYACKGYFDKEEQDIMIWRKVAQAASAGFVKSEDFEAFWPSLKEEKTPSWSETPIELRKKILAGLKNR
jgi:spore germination cell wall hydrolase CwlJ-like protein